MSHTGKLGDRHHDKKGTENVERLVATERFIGFNTYDLLHLLADEEEVGYAETNLRQNDIHVHKRCASRTIGDHSELRV